jgi:hypothetical protein
MLQLIHTHLPHSLLSNPATTNQTTPETNLQKLVMPLLAVATQKQQRFSREEENMLCPALVSTYNETSCPLIRFELQVR